MLHQNARTFPDRQRRVLEAEIGELDDDNGDEVMAELVQVAAVAFAWLENLIEAYDVADPAPEVVGGVERSTACFEGQTVSETIRVREQPCPECGGSGLALPVAGCERRCPGCNGSGRVLS